MKVLLQRVNENRERFEELHRDVGLYGSSTIGNIAGLNPYCSPMQEWVYRTGREQRPDISKLTKIRRGNAMEPVLLEMFTEATGFKAYPFNQIVQHDSLDWAIASPDGLTDEVYEGALVECKAVSWRTAPYWEYGGAPDYYQTQLQWQLGVTGYRTGFFSALIGEDLHVVPRFEFQPAIFEQLVELAERFRALVKSDTPPDARAGDDKLIKLIYKAHNEEAELDEHAAELAREYTEKSEDLKLKKKLLDDDETRIKQLKAELLLKMKGAKWGRAGRWGIKVNTTVVNPTAKPYEKTTFKVWEAGE